MPSYTVIDNLDHNGIRYSTGDEVEMTDAVAKPLIALKVIAPKPKAKAKDEPKKEEQPPEQPDKKPPPK